MTKIRFDFKLTLLDEDGKVVGEPIIEKNAYSCNPGATVEAAAKLFKSVATFTVAGDVLRVE